MFNLSVQKDCYLLCTLLLMGWTTLYGQNPAIDSLKSILRDGPRDTTKVSTLIALSTEFLQEEKMEEAIENANEAIGLATELNFIKGKAYALKNIGIAEYYKGNYKEVLNFWTQSLQTFEAISDTLGIANLANNLGAVFYDQGSLDKALDYYFRSLSISEKLKDPVRITSALVNIGGVYMQMKNFENALNYYGQVEPYLPGISDPVIHSTYLMGVGEVYSLKGEHEQAIDYFKKALEINKDTKDYAHNLTMLGKEEFNRGNIPAALQYLDRAYTTATASNSNLDQVQTLLAMGDVYQKRDLRKSLQSYQQAEILALQMETREELRDIYHGMSLTYFAENDFENAYLYQKKYIDLKDKIFNLKTDDKIRGLQFNFDLEKKEDQIDLLEKEAEIAQLQGKRQKSAIYLSLLASLVIFLLAVIFYYRYSYAKKSNKLLSAEKNRSESLLLNILPDATAMELKKNGKVEAKRFESVTVMFADFKGFTEFSQELSPEYLVKSVDYYFSGFDRIMDKYDLEKIKTIGDAYMCAGGLPYPTKDHAVRMIKASFEILEFMEAAKQHSDANIMNFEIRIGINTGPVVAGVVGVKKFAYDIWGDTVNVAARMESMSKPGSINISETTYEAVKDFFVCEQRGEIYVKNKGMMHMYYVNGPAEIPRPVISESDHRDN